MIQLKLAQWNNLKDKLKKEYPPSVMLMRSRMREVLGFTVREHHQWVEAANDIRGYYRKFIILDFYNDSAESWFRLKYMNLTDQL